jgi:hypothetical protein
VKSAAIAADSHSKRSAAITKLGRFEFLFIFLITLTGIEGTSVSGDFRFWPIAASIDQVPRDCNKHLVLLRLHCSLAEHNWHASKE